MKNIYLNFYKYLLNNICNILYKYLEYLSSHFERNNVKMRTYNFEFSICYYMPVLVWFN